MQKVKRAIPVVCGAVGLVGGCVMGYYVLAFVCTRFFVKPADVTAHDADIVFTLSIVAGIFTGWLAMQVSAQRYWNPKNADLQRHAS